MACILTVVLTSTVTFVLTVGLEIYIVFYRPDLLKSSMSFILVRVLKIMGIGPSSPGEANPPLGVRKLNSSVWELHSPSGKPEVEIIFFHGLQLGDFQDAFWKTWCARDDEQVIWPKDWLSERIPNARILSISYNSCALANLSQSGVYTIGDMYTLGEWLVHDIIMDGEHNIGQHCPVFLVGHSVGGVAIKQFLCSAPVSAAMDQAKSERLNKFIENVKGVFYYGTPHGASRVAEFVRYISELLPKGYLSPILGLLETSNTQTARLFEEFRKRRANCGIMTFAVAEGSPIEIKGFRVQVVEEGSSRLDTDTYFTVKDSNHFTVCKPRRKDDPILRKLLQFIENIIAREPRTEIEG